MAQAGNYGAGNADKAVAKAKKLKKKSQPVATGSRGDSGSGLDKPQAPPKPVATGSRGDSGRGIDKPQLPPKESAKRIIAASKKSGKKPNWKDPQVKRLQKQGLLENVGGYAAPGNVQLAEAKAPALKVLEQTTRPLHAVAGATDYAIKGKSPLKGAYEGGIKNKQIGFSDVAKSAGIKNKLVAGGLGLVGDIALDPTTYATFGAGTVEEKAALKAAKDAAKQAKKLGLNEDATHAMVRGAVRQVSPKAANNMERFGETSGIKKSTVKKLRAAQVKRAVHQAQHNPRKGLTVKFAGHEVPGIRRGTTPIHAAGGKVGSGLGKIRSKTGPLKKVLPTTERIRVASHEFRPMIRPSKQVSLAEYQATRHAKAMGRAERHMFERRGEEQTIDLSKRKHTPEEWAMIFKAVERGPRAVRKLGQHRGVAHLPEGEREAALAQKDTERNIRKTAQDVQAFYRGSLRLRKQRAGQVGEIGRNTRLGSPPRPGVPLSVSEPHRELQRLARAQAHGTPRDVLDAISRVEKAVAERQARAGEAHGYVPHMQQSHIERGDAGVESAPRSKKPGTTRNRRYLQPIDVQNPARAAVGKSEFSTAGPLVHHNYSIQTGAVLGRLKTVEGMVNAGRKLKAKTVITPAKWQDGVKVQEAKVRRQWETPNLKEGEAIYEVSRKGGVYDLRKVKGMKKRSKRGVQYVVLNEKNADSMLKPMKTIQGMLKEHGQYGSAGSAVIGGYDRATRGIKIAATGTPGFNVRNLIGDTHMHYNLAPGHRMPSNYKKAWKVVSHQSKVEVKRKLGHPAYKSDQYIMLAGKRVPLAQVAHELESHGITRGGQRAVDVKLTTNELEGISGVTQAAGGARKTKAKLSRWMQNREDLSRAASYIHLRDTGHTPDEAARIVHEGPHPDYGDLSFIEREIMRRTMPFYTFSSRSLPFHTKTLFQRPGKIANFEKVREEAQKLAGGGAAQLGETPYTQRQLPILVKNKSGKFAVQWSDPTNILNELPTTLSPTKYANELQNYGMSLVTPVFKDPVEYFNNYSFFFRSQIEPDNSPLTRAPGFVKNIPQQLRHDLRIEQNEKGQWMWPKKLNYLAKTIPGLAQQAETIATPGGSASTGSEIGSLISGVRSTKYDPRQIQLTALYNTDNQLLKHMAEIRQRFPGSYHENADYKETKAKEVAVSHEINKVSQGKYKRNSGPSKGRKGQSFPGAGGGSGGAFPGMGGGASTAFPGMGS